MVEKPLIGFLVAIFICSCNAENNRSEQKVNLDCKKHEAELTGKRYHVIGRAEIHENPTKDSAKRVNHKLSNAIGERRYLAIDDTTEIQEDCTKEGWSWIRVLEPDWLQNSHRGWVPSNVLLKSNISELSIENRISKTALLPYTKSGHPKTHTTYGARVAEIEKFRLEAAKKAINDKKCSFVQGADLSDKKSTFSNISIWIECKDGSRIYYNESELK